jgi:hypothetical protein
MAIPARPKYLIVSIISSKKGVRITAQPKSIASVMNWV